MKVALIADIHANLPALEAVLAHARGRGASAIWSAGGILGFGPFPDEVAQRLRDEFVLSTISHYDRQVLRFEKRQQKLRRKGRLEEYLLTRWTFEQLSKRSRRYLRFLSREIRLRAAGRRVLLTHAGPGAEVLDPETGEDALEQLAGEADADVIAFGDTHRPFVRQVAGVWFISPGSVGLPDGPESGANYAMVQLGPEVQVEHFRVEYDRDRLAAAIQERGLPAPAAEMFAASPPH